MPPLRYEQGTLPLLEAQKPMPIVWVMITDIVDGELSVLAARRTGSTKLTFPGGKIEPGENDEQAIIREVREETGLTFNENGDLLLPLPPYMDDDGPSTRSFCSQGKEYVAHPWMVMFDEIEKQTIHNNQPDKNEEWTWFSVKKLVSEMMQGNVPSFVLDDWLNWSIAGLYERSFPSSENDIPAAFMEECAEILEEIRFREFRKLILTTTPVI